MPAEISECFLGMPVEISAGIPQETLRNFRSAEISEECLQKFLVFWGMPVEISAHWKMP